MYHFIKFPQTSSKFDIFEVQIITTEYSYTSALRKSQSTHGGYHKTEVHKTIHCMMQTHNVAHNVMQQHLQQMNIMMITTIKMSNKIHFLYSLLGPRESKIFATVSICGPFSMM